jgi:hypothetical protein
MAVPTITSITPGSGHTGGQVLVEIIGTGFQLDPDPPADVIPVPEPPQTVEVLFGTTPALSVNVWAADRLFVVTPKLDPFDEETTFTADAGTDTLTAAGHSLTDGEIVGLATTDTLPAPFTARAGYRVLNATASTFQLELLSGGGAIDITDAGTGTHKVLSNGRVDVTVQNINEDGDVIPGETVTEAKAFAPVRPNLSSRGHMQVVLETLIQWLRREIVANVSNTTALDWDEENGTVELAFQAHFPALLLTGLDWPKNRELMEQGQPADQIDDPEAAGNVVIRRQPVIRDLVGTLVGVTDVADELVTFAEATSQFFEKNKYLDVPRDPDDLSLGTLHYQLKNTDELTITPRPADDVSWFSCDFRVLGVRSEFMPGLPQETVAGVPADRVAEPILGRTMTAEGTVEVTTLVIDDESS